jgi:hypothetical protein
MGFYFGAGESRATSLSVNAALEDANVIAYVTAGTPPYKITVTYGPTSQTKSAETKNGFATFLFDKKKDNIVPLKVVATDARNLQGHFDLNLDKEELKKAGWSLPVGGPEQPVQSEIKPAPKPGANPAEVKSPKPAEQKSVPAPNK